MLDTERAGKKVEDKEKCKTLDFPESSEVKNLPANAGDKFDPWSRKIPHASGQLSLCATTTEPPHLEPVLRNKRSHCNEGSTHCNQRVAPAHSNKDPEQPQSNFLDLPQEPGVYSRVRVRMSIRISSLFIEVRNLSTYEGQLRNVN